MLDRCTPDLPLAACLVLAGALGACSPPPTTSWSGYVEGEYVLVASPVAGTLDRLPVRSGDTVAQGAPLFTLEGELERAEREQAGANLRSAEAQAQDTTKGKRADEIAVTRAQREQAAAQAALTRAELQRQQQLFAQGFVSQAALDDARAAEDQARARLAELDASLAVAHLPARQDARIAAAAQAEAARSALRQTQWREQQTAVLAPAAGEIADTFFRVGEVVPAGQPVLSLLPAGQVKARFFVAEPELGSIAPGLAVQLHCDGCRTAIPARISFIATQAQYTPPVIYSNSQRARLVFMVEARPDAAGAARLRPGQPVDVTREGALAPAK